MIGAELKTIYSVLLICAVSACQQSQQESTPQNQERGQPFFWAVDWHPEKEQFAVGGSNDTLRILSAIDFEEIKSYPYAGTITKVKWHPSQNVLAIAVQDGKSDPCILNLNTDQQTALDSVSAEGARAIGWNHYGDLLAVADYEGVLSLFNETGKLLRRVNTGQKSIIDLDWHPTDNVIVGVGEGISWYDYETDSLATIEDRTEDILMLAVAWHPAGGFFVTGDYGDFQYHYSPLLQYWTAHGQLIKSIEDSEAEYRNLSWSNDGERLASTIEKISLWNKDGELMAEKLSANLLWGVDWNANGSRLVVSDIGGELMVLDRDLELLD
ncbi:MAG: hypothetical protein AAFY36_18240 [Bacteroidota bacterium]